MQTGALVCNLSDSVSSALFPRSLYLFSLLTFDLFVAAKSRYPATCSITFTLLLLIVPLDSGSGRRHSGSHHSERRYRRGRDDCWVYLWVEAYSRWHWCVFMLSRMLASV